MKQFLVERIDGTDDLEDRINELYTPHIPADAPTQWPVRYVVDKLTETRDNYTVVFKCEPLNVGQQGTWARQQKGPQPCGSLCGGFCRACLTTQKAEAAQDVAVPAKKSRRKWFNHSKRSQKDVFALLAAMRRAYGDDFDADNIVTVLFYTRTA